MMTLNTKRPKRLYRQFNSSGGVSFHEQLLLEAKDKFPQEEECSRMDISCLSRHKKDSSRYFEMDFQMPITYATETDLNESYKFCEEDNPTSGFCRVCKKKVIWARLNKPKGWQKLCCLGKFKLTYVCVLCGYEINQ